MSIYRAYFDESTSAESPILVVAGFLSTDANWALFETEWKEVLADFGMSAFHMVDFAHRTGEFHGMVERTRRDLIAKLLDIITRRARLGFASVVHWQEFERVFVGAERIAVGSPYNLCCTACHLEVGEWAKANYQIEPIDFFFDAGHKDAAEASKTFAETKANPQNTEYRLGTIEFSHDTASLPIQAADIAAYEIWKWLDEHFMDKTRHGRFPLEKIVQIEWKIREFDKDIIEEMLRSRRGEKVVSRVIHSMVPALRSGRTAPPTGHSHS
jgi:hypothetical protein